MSIKIYNGFRLKEQSFESMSSKFEGLIHPFLMRRAHQKIFAEALFFHDLANSGNPDLAKVFEKRTGFPLSHEFTWESLWNVSHTKNLKNHWFTGFLSARMVYLKGAAGFDYALISGIDVAEVFADLDDVEDFGYWSNSDKPDELSDKQWQNRVDEWKSVLDFTLPTAQQGQISMVRVSPYESLDEVYQHSEFMFTVPDDDSRLERLTINLAVQKAEDTGDLSDIISAMDDTLALKTYAKELAPGLLPITDDIILKGMTKRA